MKHSENLNEIGSALSKAQGEIEGAAKDSKNPFFNSSYADLASAWASCRKALSTNGIAVIQGTEVLPDQILLVTKLVHSSGQWISSDYPVRFGKNDSQGIGSAVTYARRYSLMAMVGIAAEDDDGEGAMAGIDREKKEVMRTVQKTSPASHKIASPKAAATTNGTAPAASIPNVAQGLLKLDANGCVRLKALSTSVGWTDDEFNSFLDETFKVSMLKDLTNKQANEFANIMKNNTYKQAIETMVKQ